MTAQKILELIESVDPADSVALDKIDALAYCFVHEVRFDKRLDDFVYCTPKDGKPYATHPPKYTRSRDALKAVRPEGWNFAIRNEAFTYPSTSFDCKASSEKKHIYGPELPTEELAELHAIIQAIEWERSQ